MNLPAGTFLFVTIIPPQIFEQSVCFRVRRCGNVLENQRQDGAQERQQKNNYAAHGQCESILPTILKELSDQALKGTANSIQISETDSKNRRHLGQISHSCSCAPCVVSSLLRFIEPLPFLSCP
jgi:hypothetical protein